MPAIRSGVSRSVRTSTGPGRGGGIPTKKLFNHNDLNLHNEAASSQFALSVSGKLQSSMQASTI